MDCLDNIGVTGYTIYRAASASGSLTRVGTASTNTYADTSLSEATAFYYVVRAFDGVPTDR